MATRPRPGWAEAAEAPLPHKLALSSRSYRRSLHQQQQSKDELDRGTASCHGAPLPVKRGRESLGTAPLAHARDEAPLGHGRDQGRYEGGRQNKHTRGAGMLAPTQQAHGGSDAKIRHGQVCYSSGGCISAPLEYLVEPDGVLMQEGQLLMPMSISQVFDSTYIGEDGSGAKIIVKARILVVGDQLELQELE